MSAMSRTKQLALCALMTALALALSYVERFLPLQLLIPLPGVKLGLANIVTLVALYILKKRHAFAILLLRCFLGAVFGGGISGLEAACTAAETGCRVTLLEKEAQLGGWVRRIAALPMKYRMQRLLDYQLHRAKNLKNLVCLTGITATAELVEAFKPDLVVWSTGSGPLLPPIKGLHENMNDETAPITDIAGLLKDLENAGRISGKTIGVAGGGAVALDVAEFFAERNNHVFMVEMMADVGMGMDRFSKDYFMKVLNENKAEIFRSHKLEEVKKNAFVVSADGQTKELPFDYGFICLGLRANRADCEEMREYFEDRGILFAEIGDCVRARRIFEGVTEGRNIVELLKVHGYYQ